jgi:hypothetical protein
MSEIVRNVFVRNERTCMACGNTTANCECEGEHTMNMQPEIVYTFGPNNEYGVDTDGRVYVNTARKAEGSLADTGSGGRPSTEDRHGKGFDNRDSYPDPDPPLSSADPYHDADSPYDDTDTEETDEPDEEDQIHRDPMDMQGMSAEEVSRRNRHALERVSTTGLAGPTLAYNERFSDVLDIPTINALTEGETPAELVYGDDTLALPDTMGEVVANARKKEIVRGKTREQTRQQAQQARQQLAKQGTRQRQRQGGRFVANEDDDILDIPRLEF